MQTPPTDAYEESDLLQPLPPEDWPSFDHIITEDGAPVDNVFSEKQMRLLTEPLYSSWKTDRPFVALANVGLFYGIDKPPLVPDALLSLNVRLPENLFPKLNRSYFVWKYGKPPEVAIEVVSNRKGGEDTRKLDAYADVRVANYVIFDPEHHLSADTLRIYRLNGNRLKLDLEMPWRLPEIGLGLVIWSGRFEDTDGDWLRWTDGDGKLIQTGRELAIEAIELAGNATQRADAETTRADAEAARAEAETARAEAESARAETAIAKATEAAAENARLLELLRQHDIHSDEN